MRCRPVAALLFCLAAPAARAQLLDRYVPAGIPGYPDWFADTALTRAAPGYEPLQVPLGGGFQADPVLTETTGYDSNPGNFPQGGGSAVLESNGSLHVGTDWSRNALGATVSVDDFRYFEQPTQSYTSWNAAAGGRLDLGEDALTGAYSHDSSVSLPTEVGSFGLNAPIPTVIDDGRANYQAQFGPLGIQPGVEITSYSYGQSGAAGFSAAGDDRTDYTARVALGYEISGGTSMVLAAQDTESRFPSAIPGQPRADSSDFSVLTGIDYRPAGVFRVRALVGYEQLDYLNSRLSGISAPAAELDLIWTPTELTTISGRVSQTLANSPGTPTGDYVYTDAHLELDHEYQRDLVLQAAADYQNAGLISTNGSQVSYTATLGARWMLNRGLQLALQYQFQDYQNSGAGPAFDSTRHVITLGITLRPGALD